MTSDSTPQLDEHMRLYRRAGDHAISLVERIPADGWDAPALASGSRRIERRGRSPDSHGGRWHAAVERILGDVTAAA